MGLWEGHMIAKHPHIWGDWLSSDPLRRSHDSQSPHIRKHLCPDCATFIYLIGYHVTLWEGHMIANHPHIWGDRLSSENVRSNIFFQISESKHAAKWARYLSVTWVPTILGLYERMGENPQSPIFYAVSFNTAPGPPPYIFIICILHRWEGEIGSSHSEQVTTSSKGLMCWRVLR